MLDKQSTGTELAKALLVRVHFVLIVVLVIGLLPSCDSGKVSAEPSDGATPQSPVDPFQDPVLAPTDKEGKNTNGARFGCSRNGGKKWHGGTDLKAEVGKSFVAIYAGTVQKIRADVPNDKPTAGVGNFVIIRSNDLKMSMKYCHLSEVAVKEKDQVKQGETLGNTGKSGNAYSDDEVPWKHLHIEVSTDYFETDDKYVDPEPYLKTKYGENPNLPGPTCPK